MTSAMVEADTRITQKYLRRYPDSKRTRSWSGKLVHIETENGVWRKNAQGYTYAGRPEAWVLPFEEAVLRVNHCGPEKHAAFLLATPAPSTPVAEGIVERLVIAADIFDRKPSEVYAANALCREAASTIAALSAERDALAEQKLIGWVETIGSENDARAAGWKVRALKAEAALTTAQEALDWYADRVGAVSSWSIECATARADLTEDNGRRAAEAVEDPTP